jgi:xanthine/uracil/vitamin C permease (AzgA family)
MITALAGATEVHLVVRGKYTILDMGELTPEILISMAAVIIVTVALHYHIKGAFCTGLFFGTIVWWIYKRIYPDFIEDPYADMVRMTSF